MIKSIPDYLIDKEFNGGNGEVDFSKIEGKVDDTITTYIKDNDLLNSNKIRYIKCINDGNNYDTWRRFVNLSVYANMENIAKTKEGVSVIADFTPTTTSGGNSGIDVNKWVKEYTEIIGSNAKRCTLTCDLGDTYVVDLITLTNRVSEGGRTNKIILQVSTNGNDWTTLYDYTTQGSMPYNKTGNDFYLRDYFNNVLDVGLLTGNYQQKTNIRERYEGETSDYTRIQEAIDRASKSGGEVWFKSGNYFIDKTLTLKRGVKLRGVGGLAIGENTTTNIVLMEKANCSMISPETYSGHYIQIENIVFNGNGMKQSERHTAVNFASWVTGRIENVVITNVYGSAITFGGGAMDFYVNNLWVEGCNVGDDLYQIDTNPQIKEGSQTRDGLFCINYIYSENPLNDWYIHDYKGNYLDTDNNIILTKQEDGTYLGSDNTTIYTKLNGETTFQVGTDTTNIVTAESLGLVKAFARTNVYNRGKSIRIKGAVSCTINDVHIEGSREFKIVDNHIFRMNKLTTAHCGCKKIDTDGSTILDEGHILLVTPTNKVLQIGMIENYNTNATYTVKSNPQTNNYYNINYNSMHQSINFSAYDGVSGSHLGTDPQLNGYLSVVGHGSMDSTGISIKNMNSNELWRTYVKNGFNITKDWDKKFSVNSDGDTTTKRAVYVGSMGYNSSWMNPNAFVVEDDGKIIKMTRGQHNKDIVEASRVTESEPTTNTKAYYVGQTLKVANIDNNQVGVNTYICDAIVLCKNTVVKNTSDNSEVSNTNSYSYPRYSLDKEKVVATDEEAGTTTTITYSYKYLWSKVVSENTMSDFTNQYDKSKITYSNNHVYFPVKLEPNSVYTFTDYDKKASAGSDGLDAGYCGFAVLGEDKTTIIQWITNKFVGSISFKTSPKIDNTKTYYISIESGKLNTVFNALTDEQKGNFKFEKGGITTPLKMDTNYIKGLEDKINDLITRVTALETP